MATTDKNGIFVAQEHDTINPFHSYLNAAFSTVSSAVATLIPSGAVIPFAGTALPEGWYWCDGSNYNRTTDQALFDAIGVTYGNGDGSTGSFSVPDLRFTTVVGANYGPKPDRWKPANAYSLGSTGGHETVTLNVSQIPSHQHIQSATSGPGGEAKVRNGVGRFRTIYKNAPPGWGFNSYSTYVNTLATGGGEPHSNMPPYMALNFIIKR